MKKLLVALLFAGFLGVSAAQAYEPFEAGIYIKTKSPTIEAINASRGSKIGTATCQSVLGIVNWGDCSLEKAMKNGKISRVTGADWEKFWIIVYGKKTYRVYGN